MLLGQRPDSGGGTLQSTSFLALRLQYGPDAAATTATDMRQGRDGGWHLAHGLERALCWWQAWDADTATVAKQPSAFRSRTWDQHLQKTKSPVAGRRPALPALQSRWITSEKMAECLGQRPGRTTKGKCRWLRLCQTHLPHQQCLPQAAAEPTHPSHGHHCAPLHRDPMTTFLRL